MQPLQKGETKMSEDNSIPFLKGLEAKACEYLGRANAIRNSFKLDHIDWRRFERAGQTLSQYYFAYDNLESDEERETVRLYTRQIIAAMDHMGEHQEVINERVNEINKKKEQAIREKQQKKEQEALDKKLKEEREEQDRKQWERCYKDKPKYEDKYSLLMPLNMVSQYREQNHKFCTNTEPPDESLDVERIYEYGMSCSYTPSTRPNYFRNLKTIT